MRIRHITLLLLFLYGGLQAVQYLPLGGHLHAPVGRVLPLVAFVFAVLHAGERLGARRAALLAGLTLAVSLLFESLGVSGGWIFGDYHYTERLGPRFLGLVPYSIPLSWFMMLYPALVIAGRAVPARFYGWTRSLALAGFVGLAMVAWDLVVDPVMVHAGHWVWESPGAYFGIPVSNYAGWWFTSALIVLSYEILARGGPAPAQELSFDRQAVASYALTGLGTASWALAGGLVGPALTGLLAMGAITVIGWRTDPF